ncbi:hypothetical protein GIB67_017765, partial [Kingdonia uniflora]
MSPGNLAHKQLSFERDAIVVRTRCNFFRVFDKISRDSFERLLVLFERISREIELLFKETLVFFFFFFF